MGARRQKKTRTKVVRLTTIEQVHYNHFALNLNTFAIILGTTCGTMLLTHSELWSIGSMLASIVVIFYLSKYEAHRDLRTKTQGQPPLERRDTRV